jgi:tetratricopeptide (TPR) repeat protein
MIMPGKDIFVVVTALLFWPLLAAATPSERELAAGSCLSEILATERGMNLPSGLLLSVALAESGRPDKSANRLIPWAWSLFAGGKSAVFDNRDQAVQAAADQLANHRASIDVGCMQVNLSSHPKAFRTLRQAFDPAANVAYAANLLHSLHQARGSWGAAIMAYHSGSAVSGEGLNYVSRVLDLWARQKIQLGRGMRSFVVEDSPQPLDVAVSLMAAKDYGAALEIYRTSLALTPDDSSAALGAAQCLRALGQTDQARLLLMRTLAVDPGNAAVLSALLQVIDDEPPESRRPHLLAASTLAPNRRDILARLAAPSEAE